MKRKKNLKECLANYLQGDNNYCPICYSNNLCASEPESSYSTIYIHINCLFCKSEWTEVYELRHVILNKERTLSVKEFIAGLED